MTVSEISGVWISTLPILEASGQPSPGLELELSLAYWHGEQIARPSAAEGFTVIPSGRVTSTFFGCPSAIASLFNNPEFGMLSVKLSPLGASASLLRRSRGNRRVEGDLVAAAHRAAVKGGVIHHAAKRDVPGFDLRVEVERSRAGDRLAQEGRFAQADRPLAGRQPFAWKAVRALPAAGAVMAAGRRGSPRA